MKTPYRTVCLECFALKYCEQSTRVRCDNKVFRDHLKPSHAFITQPRSCPEFEDDPPIGGEQ